MAKQIGSISLGPSSQDFRLTVQLFGETFHVQRRGADGNLARAGELTASFDGQVDAIGLEANLIFDAGSVRCQHRQMKQIAARAATTPLVDGTDLKKTLGRWALSQVAQRQPELFRYKNIFVLSGLHDYPLAQLLDRMTDSLTFGDPIFHLGAPWALKSLGQLERYARLALPRLCQSTYDRLYPLQNGRDPRAAGQFAAADVIVGDIAYLRRYAPDDLRRKTILTSALADSDLVRFKEQGVETVITLFPPMGDEHCFVDIGVIAAIFASLMDRPVTDLAADDYLPLVSRWELQPEIVVLNQPPAVDRFAFVIHPLSVDHIFNHPALKPLKLVPRRLVERLVANLPPLYLSRMTGIRSAATGQEVEGFLISLGATPREFLRRKPGFTYRRLIVASRMAQRMGAKIMGLGAFTKVVGDAGITVGQKADIAITSGNSLTVAATLEAAKQAVIQMGATDLTHGRAMVIGATGSIGAVCSRLLAQAIFDVVLVAPRPERLIALKKTIEAETPDAKVVIATDANPYLTDMDLVVTTTTAIGDKVIDILQLKPGCVVCDVARPPDVKEEDARLRPDVLVVESGEVRLPGTPDFGFDIGLPPGVAYACLAETALLAMEGRFESYTLGRDIEMERVKEIYGLFKKHGLELEGLRSFGRYVTAEQLAIKRELTQDLRRHPEKLQALRHERARPKAQTTDNGDPLQRIKARPDSWTAALPRLLVIGAGAAAVAMAWWRQHLKRVKE